MEIMKLFMTKDEDLYDKTIEDVFDDEVFDSTFWLYWITMFAFENWHSALEMKLYFQRFIHQDVYKRQILPVPIVALKAVQRAAKLEISSFAALCTALSATIGTRCV